CSDIADFPTGKEIYATRDTTKLQQIATSHGKSIGVYAGALLDSPLPWTKMRQVYKLLGLVKTWGPLKVDKACSMALECEVVNVYQVERIIKHSPDGQVLESFRNPVTTKPRFARDKAEFVTSEKV
ncbi:transposase, partial [mine drainage metagenome]